MLLGGCSSASPVWREDARALFDRVRMEGADKVLPEEYASFDDTLLMGEALLLEDEPEEADSYFHLAWTKGKLLDENLAAEKFRQAALARLKNEREQREREWQKYLLKEQERLLRKQAVAAEAAEREKKQENSRPNKERPLPAFHTVARGETLPHIAAEPDVYNDQTLWPLLYRANRDQISDPGHIRPGQTLRIPRNMNREELVEARHYAQEKPLH
ncbi:MAG TPA: LysM peptidoglycan-binding domain-containing protein [Geobacteraceae bacterium]|nr:LysM peptidoglycan-binding domain-containing protein [Geobacteraceae bacterium]